MKAANTPVLSPKALSGTRLRILEAAFKAVSVILSMAAPEPENRFSTEVRRTGCTPDGVFSTSSTSQPSRLLKLFWTVCVTSGNTRVMVPACRTSKAIASTATVSSSTMVNSTPTVEASQRGNFNFRCISPTMGSAPKATAVPDRNGSPTGRAYLPSNHTTKAPPATKSKGVMCFFIMYIPPQVKNNACNFKKTCYNSPCVKEICRQEVAL